MSPENSHKARVLTEPIFYCFECVCKDDFGEGTNGDCYVVRGQTRYFCDSYTFGECVNCSLLPFKAISTDPCDKLPVQN